MACIIWIVVLILCFDYGDLALEGNRPLISRAGSPLGGWKFVERSEIETFHLCIELVKGFLYSAASSWSAKASHTQLSVLHRTNSDFSPMGSQVRQPESQLQGILITGVISPAVFSHLRIGGILSLWFHLDRWLFSTWPVCLSQMKWQVILISFTQGIVDCLCRFCFRVNADKNWMFTSNCQHNYSS